jgi:hypothetical protein
MRRNADKLLKRLLAAEEWPLKSERKIHEEIALWRALREGDRDFLKRYTGWAEDRSYYLDPLAERIPETWADLLFGDDPTIEPAAEGDAPRLEEIVEENDLPSSLQEAEETCAAEREVWWRVFKDSTVLSVPTIEWHSRLDVIPEYVGRKLAAAAVVSEVGREEGEQTGKATVWRYIAIHEEGSMLNLLFKGEDGRLGEQKQLSDHPAVADLQEVWQHGLSTMLVGRVVNKRAPRNEARSVYHGIRDYLLALNENFAIGQENARATGKKRAFITPDMLGPDGKFPSDADFFIRQPTDNDPDKPADPLVQLEWEFDAAALIQWDDHLEERAITRARIAPQLIGQNTEGALTGPALRARLLDTLLARMGKGRFWDDELPQCLLAAQMVDDLAEHLGGFGRGWADAAGRPSVERGDALPVDAGDEVERIASEISAEILSTQTAIEERHPDWDPDRVLEEMARILKDRPAPAPDPFEPPPAPEPDPVPTS